MNTRIGEICAGCGNEIGMLQASYYSKDPTCDIGKTYHSHCGDPFGIEAKIAAEREACAKVAEWTDHGENRPKAKAANDRIAAAIRARALVAEQETKP